MSVARAAGSFITITVTQQGGRIGKGAGTGTGAGGAQSGQMCMSVTRACGIPGIGYPFASTLLPSPASTRPLPPRPMSRPRSIRMSR